jgi:hypothetical protein
VQEIWMWMQPKTQKRRGLTEIRLNYSHTIVII